MRLLSLHLPGVAAPGSLTQSAAAAASLLGTLLALVTRGTGLESFRVLAVFQRLIESLMVVARY